MNKFNQNLLFLGGDKRQEHIYKIISQKYKNTDTTAVNGCELDKHKLRNADMLILPTIASTDNHTLNAPEISNKIQMQDIFKGAVSCKRVIAGKMSASLVNEAANYGLKCVQYVESEPFKILNAVPTAEGAICIAINNTEKTLWGAKCLVIGNGCIGKALTSLLKSFGSDVTVSARKEKDFAELKSKGFKWIKTENINDSLFDYDIIFNTVPHRVIESDTLISLPRDKLIIDLASKPYGLDHSLTDVCKCKMILGASLPGIYSPVTAAEIAAASIEQLINEVVNDE